ncbi:hypothetical protein AB0L75_43465 [Streptomyces sp. NPDC052101]|uniref:hypothetical protein n=1 Tax=Streptomyces sp. NPDC052101 TaxID=3155763 RepID=UPI00343B01B8
MESVVAMVGLFWITPEAMYLGSPPAADGRCVRLNAAGLEAVDPERSRTWTWEELRAVTVEEVPRQGMAGRLSGIVDSLVMSLGGGEVPPTMTLRLETRNGPERLRIYSAAAGGYSAEEEALSQELLGRIAAGPADL